MRTKKILSLVILIQMGASIALYAQFKKAVTIDAAIGSVSDVHAADIDGDGDQDLVYAEDWTNKDFGWYENINGKGIFIKHVIAQEDKVQRTYVADIDGDGDQDILFSGETDGEIAWYENDGSENFTRHSVITGLDDPLGVYAQDMEGDGDIDLYSASEGNNTISWYENDGSENFTAHNVTTTALGAIGVTAIDVDGDSEIDLVPVNSGESGACSECKLSWYKNDGSENFTEQTVSTNSKLKKQAAVQPIDMDKDGDIDLIVAVGTYDKVSFMENDGNENFTEQILTSNFDDPSSIKVVDSDGDGDLDIFVASYSKDNIGWLENKGNGSYTNQSIDSTVDGPNGIEVADFNGDSKLDIAAPLKGDDKAVWYEQIVPKPSFPNFKQNDIATFTNGSGEFDIQSIDLDFDGDMDFVVQSQNNNELSWYENNGSTVFTHHSIAVEYNAHKLQVIDFDFDGDLDVVTHNVFSNNAYYYKNDGSEAFSKTSLFAAAGNIQSFLAIDLDADGDSDLITVNKDQNKLYYYRNSGSNFSSYNIGTGTSATGEVYFETADIDKDGNTDVVTAFNNDDTIIWYEFSGTTGFIAHSVSTGATSVKSIAVEDLDKDGDVDIMASHSGKLVWYENDGSEVFIENEISTDGSKDEIKILDLDTDGDYDIVIGKSIADGVEWYENDGAQSFKKHTIAEYAEAQAVEAIAVVDLDGDHDLDILSISESDKKISWFENITYGDLLTLGGADGAMWRLVSSPTADATLNDLAESIDIQGFTGGANPSDDKNVFYYDDAGAWETPTSINTSFRSGYGYAIWVYGDKANPINLRGNEPKEDVTINLNKSTLHSSAYYTLAGNPFYSNYNLNALTVNAGTVQDNVHFWDANFQSYRVKDRTQGAGYIVSPYQGFWVEVSNGSSATSLTFPTSGKTDSGTTDTWLHKQVNQKRSDISFTLESAQGTHDKSLRLSFRDYASIGWDRADAAKLEPLNDTFATLSFAYNTDGKELTKSVESLPFDLQNEIELPLKLNKNGVEGEFTLAWEGITSLPEGWVLAFEDMKNGTRIHLTEAEEYTFTSNADESDEETRFVLKLEKSVSVSAEEMGQPSTYILEQNYPNPFNPSTTISYSLAKAGQVEISVYNLIGQQVATIVNEIKSAGIHSAQFDASSLSSGIYIYTIKANGFSMQRRMTLIK
ncbi:MAG: T9SS type A sorting domain-containing protein [Balneola sp.]